MQESEDSCTGRFDVREERDCYAIFVYRTPASWYPRFW